MILKQTLGIEFIAFGMGFADAISFKKKTNVFKIYRFTLKDETPEETTLKVEYYEYGYAAGKELMDNTIEDISSRN